MTYFDSKRLAKIEHFQNLVKARHIEPYYSQLLRDDWSPGRLLEAYHHHYYRRYYQQSKARRCVHFLEKSPRLLLEHPINGGIYIIRTAVLEGLVVEPDTAELTRLQSLWHYLLSEVGDDDYFKFIHRYLSPLNLYYSQDLPEFQLSCTLKYRRNQLVAKLSEYRYQSAQRSLDGYGGQPLQPLWQWIMLFDQEEAEHLASLSDAEYYNSDYWQELSQYHRQQNGETCPHCGAQAPLIFHSPYREYRGQEYFMPQAVSCRCQQCAHQ